MAKPRKKRGSEAEVRWERSVEEKGKPPRATAARDVRRATDVLLGDCNAKVSRTRTIKHSISYGQYSISGSCTVSLHCNQDDETIAAASQAAIEIVDRVMEEDDAMMAGVIEQVVQGVTEDPGS